jgi:hypothetical protein
MAYCTVNDVERYYLGTDFGATSAYVTDVEVGEFIDEEAAAMNLSLKKKYALPITDADDLTVLKSINAKLVVGIIDEIIREKDPEGKLERSRSFRKEAMDTLKAIETGDITLMTSGKGSPIKFNQTDSDGETVEKEFKLSDADI